MTRTVKTITLDNGILYEFRELDELGRGRNTLPHGEVRFDHKYIDQNRDTYEKLVGKLCASWFTNLSIDYMNTLLEAPKRTGETIQGSFSCDKPGRPVKLSDLKKKIHI